MLILIATVHGQETQKESIEFPNHQALYKDNESS